MAGTPKRWKRGPEYPTRAQIQAGIGPSATHSTSGTPLLYAEGIVIVLLAGGMGELPAQAAEPAGTSQVARSQPHADAPATQPAAARHGMAVVAPIFERGAGRGATGCIVISPPVFMTEEEARIIIKEELEKLGLNLTEKDMRLEGVTIAPQTDDDTRRRMADLAEALKAPATQAAKAPDDLGRLTEMLNRMTQEDELERLRTHHRPQPVHAMLADPAKHVAIVFVSTRDCDRLRDPSVISSVHDYPFKSIAQAVAQNAQMGGKDGYVGVLYDPAGPDPEHVEDVIAKAAGPNANERARFQAAMKVRDDIDVHGKEMSQDEFRKQVHDFAAWLKERGVI